MGYSMVHSWRGIGRLSALALFTLGATGLAAPAAALTPPPAPTSVAVTPGKSQATISWTAGVVTADSAPVTGFVVTAILAGGASGPTCATPATETTCTIVGIGGTVQFTVQATSDAGSSAVTTSQQLVITDKWAPPSPVKVQAKIGARPGEAVVTWQPGTAAADDSTPDYFLVSASPTRGQGPLGTPSCGYVDPSKTRCTLTGLAPNTGYRFSVTAGSLSGESQPAISKPITIPGWSVTTPVQAVLCSGSELETPDDPTVRPTQVIIDCDAYGPQYGAPLVRTIDGITWSRWTTVRASGRGVLHWPTAVPCTQGQPLSNCGVTVTDYPVTIRLQNPQPLNAARTRFTFTEVGLFPTATGPQDCQTSCWIVPPRVAYQ